jgi:hypothetical protein
MVHDEAASPGGEYSVDKSVSQSLTQSPTLELRFTRRNVQMGQKKKGLLWIPCGIKVGPRSVMQSIEATPTVNTYASQPVTHTVYNLWTPWNAEEGNRRFWPRQRNPIDGTRANRYYWRKWLDTRLLLSQQWKHVFLYAQTDPDKRYLSRDEL